MRNRPESYKKIYVTIADALFLTLATLCFSMVWLKDINQLMRVYFQGKGNLLIILCYIAALIIMLHIFGGLKLDYYKIANLLISQFFGLVCTHIILTIQMILMVGRVAAIGAITKNMVILFLINFLVISCITIISVKIYNRLFPPYKLLHVHGDYKNNLKKKISMRSDRYVIEKDIHFSELEKEYLNEFFQYDGIVLNDIPSAEKNNLLKICFDHRIRVYFVPKISDIFVKAAEEINVFDTPMFLCQNMDLSISQKIAKRVMDIFLSMLVLIITSPIMGVVALIIKMEDGGPVIYSQERCTIDGKCFMLHKFRSMRVNAEEGGGARLAKKDDDRITKIGKVIRASRIDELPQLANILKGEMSFVGPRPERPEFVRVNSEEIPEFQYRMKVKAGLTGYAQVFGKYNTSFLDKLKLDLLYIEKYSILLDIQIILMTLKVIILKESSEGVED